MDDTVNKTDGKNTVRFLNKFFNIFNQPNQMKHYKLESELLIPETELLSVQGNAAIQFASPSKDLVQRNAQHSNLELQYPAWMLEEFGRPLFKSSPFTSNQKASNYKPISNEDYISHSSAFNNTQMDDMEQIEQSDTEQQSAGFFSEQENESDEEEVSQENSRPVQPEQTPKRKVRKEEDCIDLGSKSSFAFHIKSHKLSKKSILAPSFPKDEPYYARKKNYRRVKAEMMQQELLQNVQNAEPRRSVSKEDSSSPNKNKVQPLHTNEHKSREDSRQRYNYQPVSKPPSKYANNIDSGYIRTFCPICPLKDDENRKPVGSQVIGKGYLKPKQSQQMPESKPHFFGDRGLNINILNTFSSQLRRWPEPKYNYLKCSPITYGGTIYYPYHYNHNYFPKQFSCPPFSENYCREEDAQSLESQSNHSISPDNQISPSGNSRQIRQDSSPSRQRTLHNQQAATDKKQKLSKNYATQDYTKNHRYLASLSVSSSSSSQNAEVDQVETILQWLSTFVSNSYVYSIASSYIEAYQKEKMQRIAQAGDNHLREILKRRPLSKSTMSEHNGQYKPIKSKSVSTLEIGNRSNNKEDGLKRKFLSNALSPQPLEQNKCQVSKSNLNKLNVENDGLIRKPLSVDSSSELRQISSSKSKSLLSAQEQSSQSSLLSCKKKVLDKKKGILSPVGQLGISCRTSKSYGNERSLKTCQRKCGDSKSCVNSLKKISHTDSGLGKRVKKGFDSPQRTWKQEPKKIKNGKGGSSKTGTYIGTERSFDRYSNTEFVTFIYSDDD